MLLSVSVFSILISLPIAGDLEEATGMVVP